MNKLLYKASIERSIHQEYAAEWCGESDEYWEKYMTLVNELDGESTEVVNTVLSRLKQVLSTNDDEMDMFSEEEIEGLERIKTKLTSRVFALKKNLYVYKNYYLPQNYFEPIAYYYGYYLDRFKNQQRIHQGNYIDGGAYIGDTSIFFSRETTGKIFSWEPIKKNICSIEETIRLNRLNNIEIVNKATGAKSGISIASQNSASNLSTLVPYSSRSYTQESVEIQTIDDYVKERNMHIDVIKLHVEGAEYDSIIGAVKTIERYRPILIIHIHHTPRDFFEIKPFIEGLDLGYEIRIVKPINRCVLTGTLLIAESEK